MSQPPKTRFSISATGTKSLTIGERSSDLFPSLIDPICVILPIGFERPLLQAMTPQINVLATAPIPGISTPTLEFSLLIFFFFVVFSI